MGEGGIRQWFSYIEQSDKLLREQHLAPLTLAEKDNIARKLEDVILDMAHKPTDTKAVSQLGTVIPNLLTSEVSKIRTIDWTKCFKSKEEV